MTKKSTEVKNPHAPREGMEVYPFKREVPMAEGYFDQYGRERPSPLPIQPPIGYKKTPSLREQIRAMILSEKMREYALSQGAETFEEADDFDIGDDFDPTSPYEMQFEPGDEPPAPSARPAPGSGGDASRPAPIPPEGGSGGPPEPAGGQGGAEGAPA